jgi:hypothetical protein
MLPHRVTGVAEVEEREEDQECMVVVICEVVAYVAGVPEAEARKHTRMVFILRRTTSERYPSRRGVAEGVQPERVDTHLCEAQPEHGEGYVLHHPSPMVAPAEVWPHCGRHPHEELEVVVVVVVVVVCLR